MKRKINSLYIHIPFCKSICPYCDFCKIIYNENYEDLYIKQLMKDLSVTKDRFFKFKTIYIGGGTPSILKNNNLKQLLSYCKTMLFKGGEFTIEANPEDINDDFLETCQSNGINRISIGIQTFNNKLLDVLHRNYGLDINSLIKNVKKYIKNINVDLIYGLPGENLSILKEDLNNFIKLNINHISTYSLSINKGTEFYNKKIKQITEDDSADYYNEILKFLRNKGFVRYEVSNFAIRGFESKHNINYWRNKEYVGLGLGSSGYVGDERYTNTRNMNEYCNGINQLEKEKISLNILKEYYFITNLRLSSGFSLKEYKQIFKKDFLEEYSKEIHFFIKNKILIINKDRVKCSDYGLITLDDVLLALI